MLASSPQNAPPHQLGTANADGAPSESAVEEARVLTRFVTEAVQRLDDPSLCSKDSGHGRIHLHLLPGKTEASLVRGLNGLMSSPAVTDAGSDRKCDTSSLPRSWVLPRQTQRSHCCLFYIFGFVVVHSFLLSLALKTIQTGHLVESASLLSCLGQCVCGRGTARVTLDRFDFRSETPKW